MDGLVQSTNVGAGREANEPEHAALSGGASIWFKWVAPSARSVTFSTASATFDAILAVYSGPALDALTEQVSSWNSGNGHDTAAEFRAAAGQAYYIAIDGLNGSVGTFELACVTNSAPGNDDFADAIPLSADNGAVTGTTVGATHEVAEPDHTPKTTGVASVWYSLQPPNNGALVLDTEGSNFDTMIAVYTGATLQSLVRVAQNDDDASLDPLSRVEFEVAAGTHYWIAVDGESGKSGALNLNWNLLPRPSNDDFEDAMVMPAVSGTLAGLTTDATKQLGEPNHVGNAGGASVWYWWIAPSDGKATIDTMGSDFDTLLAVYNGASVDDLLEVVSDDDSGGNRTSSVSFLASAGTIYWAAVDGYGGVTGNVLLHWKFSQVQSSAALPPANSLQIDELARVRARQKGALAAAEVEICDEPAAPNRGVVAAIGGENNVFYFVAENQLLTGTQTLTIQHSIITTNTPRARDLKGKLRLKWVSGDPGVIGYAVTGNGYLAGSETDVVERGHSGCGVHDWHAGTYDYDFKAVKPGKLVLRAELDPDPDDGGDGPPVLSAEFTIYVVIIRRDKDLWWFNGADAVNYDERVAVTAVGVSAGASWTIVEGPIREYNPSMAPSPSGNLRIVVQGTNFSTTLGDASVALYLGGKWFYHRLTVWAPVQTQINQGFPWDETMWDIRGVNGFITWYERSIYKNITGELVPDDIEANESVTNFRDVYAGQNSNRFFIKGKTIDTGELVPPTKFGDRFSFSSKIIGIWPLPVGPNDSTSWDPIFDADQAYFMGSKKSGKGIMTDELLVESYRGRARQYYR